MVIKHKFNPSHKIFLNEEPILDHCTHIGRTRFQAKSLRSSLALIVVDDLLSYCKSLHYFECIPFRIKWPCIFSAIDIFK